MANTSFAKVTFTARKVGTALESYLKASEKDSDGHAVDYTLLEDWARTEVDADTAQFSGFATGRWAYSNNLRGYLASPHKPLPAWFERDGHLYPEVVAAWEQLRREILSSGGSVEVFYVDFEPGMETFVEGSWTLNADTCSTAELVVAPLEVTVENLVELLDMDPSDAREYVG